ncbi:MAG: imidazolonepropionase-like amidohydrolase [Glaciecola sp.]|jgi:imidazolonepropionase-like amidohydrolase
MAGELSMTKTGTVTLRIIATAATALAMLSQGFAQDNATPNGVADDRNNAYAFTNATIYQPNGEFLQDGTMLVSNGEIVEINSSAAAPEGYFEIDLEGDFIYPGFIDAYSGYGMPEVESESGRSFRSAEVMFSSANASNVNDAIKADFRASTTFVPDEEVRGKYRELGFSSVLSFRADGIARGTSALVTLGDENANESIIVPDAATHYSLSKGTSKQSVPVSLMGAFALIRQTHFDAQWFGSQDPRPFTDHSLEALNSSADLPKILEVNNWHQALTADKVGDEFEMQYVLKTAGDSYQRADLIKATGATLIVPVSFPENPEVDDILLTDGVSFSDLKHWELAPYNLKILAENDIEFAVTTDGASDEFWNNLRKAVANGLPKQTALDSITRIPAELLGVADRVGQLQADAMANFVITSADIFDEGAVILENWIQGNRFEINANLDQRGGSYQFTVNDQDLDFTLSLRGVAPSAEIGSGDESTEVAVELFEDLISMGFNDLETGERIRLTGWSTVNGWQGNGRSAGGTVIDWTLSQVEDNSDAQVVDEVAASSTELPSPILYPFGAYGSESLPQQNDLLIQGATVWTNEDEGILVTDVLVRDGKIAEIGNDLSASGATIVDGSGKHLTPGIIDEHSHIGLFNINEIATNSSMVRMKDVVDSESINIYRNLAGGVVAAQLLHGSANPIGGQSALIKMRWGQAPNDLLIEGADEFIKFALGENVKRSSNPASVRYPQTRMGVEQVFVNAFSQAQEYEKEWGEYNSLSRSQQRNAVAPRRDLVHEAMLEILNRERFVTSHSYVQSEINMLMEVADSFDFNINTFTHILEGYKVADKMAEHGAGGSTFSDWWGYKWEVRYAIPYNAALMQQAGVVVALNSDDAEMSRRLNQEAAKAVKYGNVSEIDALKMVTLNPAKLLHLDDRMGSILVGKDADLVLWSDHPLSVYAAADTTWVDGIPFYSREQDRLLRQQISDERDRIISKISAMDK